MEPQSKLLKINKNEYLAQQKSNLENALEMGLTKDEYDLICKKINPTTNIKVSNDKVPNNGYTLSNKKILKTGRE